MLNLQILDGYTFGMSPLVWAWVIQTLNLQVIDGLVLSLRVHDLCRD